MLLARDELLAVGLASVGEDVRVTPQSPEGGSAVRYRPIEAGDAQRMWNWVSDVTIRSNLGLRSHPSLEKTLAWITRSTTDPSLRGMAILAEGEHVGNVVLDGIDPSVSSARLSIYLGVDSARGRGIGLASTRHALHVAFHELLLNKVWLIVHCRNTAAIRTYYSAGFSLEGILREEFPFEGRLDDCVRMGITHRDYRHLSETST